MEFWSTGLGKRSMGIEVGKEAISLNEDMIFMSGIVKPPLSWHYTIIMDKDDWLEFFEIAFYPIIISYLMKAGKRRIMLKAGKNLFLFFVKYTFCLCLGFFRGREAKSHTEQE